MVWQNLARWCKKYVTLLPNRIYPVHSKSRRNHTGAYANLRGVVQHRKLFTPGPLMVSEGVKQAMLTDVGTRHVDFAYIVKFVRNSLLQIARVSDNEYTVIPLDGNGTFATEAALRTMLGSKKGKLLVLENGMHGKRIAQMCTRCGINVELMPVCRESLQNELISANDINGVLMIHCETSSGMINPVNEFAEVIRRCSPESLVFVDAMTSFGAIELDMRNIDFVISNSCKCLQGVPGISFVIARKEKLEKHRVCTESIVLDIGAQYDELERTGQFRFTPPTHVMLAFKEALLEYSEEGGLAGRAARYQENTKILKDKMSEMGFTQLFKDEENPQGYIVTTFLYPNNPLFVFDEFYNRLSDTGHVICCERTNAINCFRIGSIGNLTPDDMRTLVDSIRQVCTDMRIKLPLEEINF